MARAKKTTVSKAKTPTTATKVKDGVQAIVDALNTDYAAVCKRVHEQEVNNEGLESRDRAAAKARLDEIDSGKYEYSRKFTTKKSGKFTQIQYESDGKVQPIGYVNAKGQVVPDPESEEVRYELTNEVSLAKAVEQADWGGNFIAYEQE